MSTMGKDLARGCGRSAVVQVIAWVIGLPLGCLIVGGNLWVVNTFYDRPLIIGMVLAASLIIVFGGSISAILVSVVRRKVQFDAAFEPLGLGGEVYQSFFRQYHGTVQGRSVAAYFYRGPVLEIEVETRLQTRLGVTRQEHADTRFLGGLMQHTPLVLDDSALAELMVYAPEEVWARELLARPHVVDALLRLTALTGMFTRQQVILSPGTWKLMCSGSRRLFGIELSMDQVRGWLDDLFSIAGVAESGPAPRIVAELTSVERFARKSRRKTKYLALWAALATVVFFIVVSVIVAVIVFVLSRMDGGL
ncbi:MAG: hypothetical protein MUQ30_17025 [Anaerolineae bacterium]|nr:hypothetical protein [Anaerolineae bacterium]